MEGLEKGRFTEYPIELRDWIFWAENHAKELNPLVKGVLPGYKKATEILNLEDIEYFKFFVYVIFKELIRAQKTYYNANDS